MTSATRRESGIGVPLFSLTSTASWGIGEFADLPAFASWCHAAGQRAVQVLPLNEISPGETSPYSSMSAMALDPIYVHVPAVADFAALGGVSALDAADRVLLAELRASDRVRYGEIRALKSRWLRRAYQRFVAEEIARSSDRARAFEAYVAREGWWLDVYTAFRALHAAEEERAWWQWPAGPASADAAAVTAALGPLAEERRYRAYLQWIAEAQWQEARRQGGLRVFGDLPFMVSGDSPDVWARRQEFMLDATVGVPPDAFSETGQDWGLPPWRWEAMERTGFRWMRDRARRTAALFDGVRVDHLVGFYRVYVRPIDETRPKVFSPPDERTQSRLGATLLNLYLGSGVEVIAEDLGTVPPFVRWSMARLGVPGFKVMRWERAWDMPGRPFVDPAGYPEASVALSGTHDTESLPQWWHDLPVEDRRMFAALPSLSALAVDPEAPFDARLGDGLIRSLLAGASRYVQIPLQDAFGWDVRINTPATVTDRNWTWRVAVAVDAWRDSPEWVARAAALRAWCGAARRL